VASPQLQMILTLLRARPPAAELSIEESRAEFEGVASQFQPAADVRCEPVDARGVPGEWISTPESTHERVIYYLHGGAYFMGSVNTHRVLISRLSRAARARALAIDYRLAPENPFPAAVEDSTSAYRWLISSGADPARLVIAGDSAGGGLTLATLVALRDAGDPLPAAAVCLSPWVDLEGLGESMISRAEADPMIQRDSLIQAGKTYLGDADPHTPLAAPLYADFRGLPPLLIQVGTAEALLDDAARIAERARAAGVEVIFEPWDEMFHVWQFCASILPEGQDAIDRIGEFVRKRTG
jgi:monoterpene epsilon-lactone hydrolase